MFVCLGASCQPFVIRNCLQTLNSCKIFSPMWIFLGFWICCSPLNFAQNDTNFAFMPFFPGTYLFSLLNTTLSYSKIVLYSRDDQGWWTWSTKKSTLAHLQESFMATWQYWSGINKPECVFRAIQNTINDFLRNFKNILF